jgi:prepilin-type N-terminal cleavage/methylation domain-containing protein
MRRRRSEQGFTLVEALLVTAMVGILAMVGPRLMINLQKFYMQTTARNVIQRDARAIIDLLNRFLRQGKYRTIIIDTPTGQGPYSRITFEHIDGRSVSFYQSGENLIQSIDGTTTTICRNLIYIAFSFPRSDFPRLVSVSMTIGELSFNSEVKELELTIQKVRVMN